MVENPPQFNPDTVIRFFKSVPALFEEGATVHAELYSIKNMPKNIMTYNEIKDLQPDCDGFDFLPLCYN